MSLFVRCDVCGTVPDPSSVYFNVIVVQDVQSQPKTQDLCLTDYPTVVTAAVTSQAMAIQVKLMKQSPVAPTGVTIE